MKKLHPLTLALAATLTAAPVAHAANWLVLQGTEPPGQAKKVKTWGFIQFEYTNIDNKQIRSTAYPVLDGKYIVPNQVAPDLQTHEGFNIKRARLGVRGNPFPLDNKINYFLLAEFGNNPLTNSDSGRDFMRVTDASITYNFTKNHHLRAGLFRIPMGDESIEAIMFSPYINYTAVTNQLLLERFLRGTGTTPNRANIIAPIGGYRDTGLEWFGTINHGSWEHSYALMYSNGNGVEMNDTDGNKDFTWYWASTYLLGGGRGPFRHEFKAYLWKQQGKRRYDNGITTDDYDRIRQGIGLTYFDGKYRLRGEYIQAEGMIFAGLNPICGPGSDANFCAPANGGKFNAPLTNDKADGWYVDFGYYLNHYWSGGLRYDTLNRGTDTPTAKRVFNNWTLGVQYSINKKTRLAVNYEIRNASAPNNPQADDIVKAFGNRLTVQFQTIF